MRCSAIACVLFLLSTAAAQVPTTAPSLAVSKEEYMRRMERLNRKASTQPKNAGLTDLEIDRLKMSSDAQIANASESLRWADETLAKASQVLPQLRADLADVRSQGIQAEAELNDILRRYEALKDLAQDAGHSTFTGQSYGTARVIDQDGDQSVGAYTGSFSGELYDPDAQLRAVMAVESRFAPEVKDARERVTELYRNYRRLSDACTKWSAAADEATRVHASATRQLRSATIKSATADSLRKQQPASTALVSAPATQPSGATITLEELLSA